ncbi:MAG: ECF-type sigma factor, partial [Planctomycetota bacterium]
MNDEYQGTITRLLVDFQDGDETSRKSALEQLWKAYFHRLLGLVAEGLTAKARRVADADDVLISVFQTLYRRATTGDIPELSNRDEFLAILIRKTRDKAIARNRELGNQKRGGEEIPECSIGDFKCVLELEDLLELKDFIENLKDSVLQDIVVMRLMGNRNDEIAEKLGVSESTVDRKVR